jgi:hypothetical protein
VARLRVAATQTWAVASGADFRGVEKNTVWVIPREKSACAQYLADDSWCAISFDEAEGPRKVVAQCAAHTVEKPNTGGQCVPIAGRTSTRYLGENGPKYWLFRLDPVKVQTWQCVDWAARYE